MAISVAPAAAPVAPINSPRRQVRLSNIGRAVRLLNRRLHADSDRHRQLPNDARFHSNNGRIELFYGNSQSTQAVSIEDTLGWRTVFTGCWTRSSMRI